MLFRSTSDLITDYFDVSYLPKILALARENNMQIVCFTTPDHSFQERVIPNYFQAIDSLTAVLRVQGITSIIRSASNIRSDISCFNDPGHLNNYGRYFHTIDFAKDLQRVIRN